MDFPVAFWGGIRAGNVVLPLNTLLTAEQYAYILVDSRASALVVAAPLAKTILSVLDRLPRLRTVILIDAGATETAAFSGRDVHDFSDVIARGSADVFVAPTLSDEVAFWMYTSGSTGEPKGVKHVHTTLMAAARLMGQGVIGIREDDVVFSAAKLFFSYGLGNAMAFPMSVGATTVLLPRAADAGGGVRGHAPPPANHVLRRADALCGDAGAQGHARGAGSDRLRLCVSAGEALPADLGKRWRERPGVDILDGIGSTEMFQTFLSNRPGDVRYGTSGKPVPGYDIKLVDEQGTRGRRRRDRRDAGARARPPARATGTSAPRAARTFAGEWTHTGDKFSRDADGYYIYCGRTDDMFKVQRHVGVAVRGGGALVGARGGARGRRHRQGGCRRPDQAEGLHRAASDGYAMDEHSGRRCACT